MKKYLQSIQSLRFRIVISFVIFLVVAIELLGLLLINQAQRRSVADSERRMTIPTYLNRRISTALASTPVGENQQLQDIVTDFAALSSIEGMTVYDQQGQVRATTGAGRQKALTANERAALAGQKFRSSQRVGAASEHKTNLITPIFGEQGNGAADQQQIVGVAVVNASLKEVYDNSQQLLYVYFLGGLLVVLAAVYLSISLARTVTQPLRIIGKQTAQIAKGDYSVFNDIRRSDELGRLAQSVNTLSRRIERSTETLSAERNRLQSILQHMADGVLLTDRNGYLTILNQAALDFLSVDLDQALGRSVLDLLALPEQQSLRDLIKEPEGTAFSLKLGGRTLEVRPSLIQTDTGALTGLVLILHDITDQERLEEERRLFVSNVSHELRTPLTSVRSYIEALNDGALADEQTAQQFIQVIQNETDRMARMIGELLELSRIDQGTMDVHNELINLNHLLIFILNRFDMMLLNDQQNGNLVIRRDIQTPVDVWVDTDHDKLMRVLDNLLNNAIKYSPDGGAITVSLRQQGDQVLLGIADQGLGIPKEDLDKVFTRFFRVDKSRSRRQGGTGLGLAIAKEIIGCLGGRIWVESTYGQGSTFWISLTYVKDELLLEERDWDDE